MKTGLAVTLAALVLATACSGNRTEAPAQPEPAAAAPAETPAAPPPATEPAPESTEVATTTTTTPAPVASDPAPVRETERAAEPPPPPPPAPPPVPAAQKAPDPLELMRENEAKRADYKQKLTEAEAKLLAADASIGEWQNTVLAFKNPFRPRPALTAEQAQAIEGKDGASRVGWAEGKLAEARAERDAAQKALDDLKANPPPY